MTAACSDAPRPRSRNQWLTFGCRAGSTCCLGAIVGSAVPGVLGESADVTGPRCPAKPLAGVETRTSELVEGLRDMLSVRTQGRDSLQSRTAARAASSRRYPGGTRLAPRWNRLPLHPQPTCCFDHPPASLLPHPLLTPPPSKWRLEPPALQQADNFQQV